jgi:hypothetical protein
MSGAERVRRQRLTAPERLAHGIAGLPKAGETLHFRHPTSCQDSGLAWTGISWALRRRNGTLKCGQVDCLDIALTESCPKNGDVPRSPLPENGSLMPSAGTIFNLRIEIVSYQRNHRRRHSPPAFQASTPHETPSRGEAIR